MRGANNAINAGNQKRRSFVAMLLIAGYGWRYILKEKNYGRKEKWKFR
jgi:hypothetical protein